MTGNPQAPRTDAVQHEALLRNAIRLQQRGEVLRAELLYRRILAGNPNHAHALHLLGTVALAAGKPQAAEPMLARALLLRPGDADYALVLGNAHAMQGRFASAAQQYRYALSLQPLYLQARFNLANALRDANRVEEALAEYRELIAQRPRFAAAQSNYANLLANTDRADEAMLAITRFLKLAPKDAPAHYNHGNLLLARGDRQGALAAFRRSVRADPKFALSHNNLGALFQEAGQPEQAIQHYTRALELAPTLGESLLNLARLKLDLGDGRAGVSYLRRYLALAPDHLEVRQLLALHLVSTRQFGAAKREYERILEQLPGDARMNVNLGNVLQAMNQLAPAIAHYREALRIDPSLVGARYNLGVTLRKDERQEDALPELEAAWAADPSSTQTTRALANLYLDLGRMADSERAFRRTLELDPQSHEAKIGLSGVLISTERFGEGWDLDTARFEQAENRDWVGQFTQRPWRGEALAGKRVLVWGEQAPGDQIMFVEALPDLLRQGGKVLLECSPRMIDLFGRSFPEAALVPRGDRAGADPKVLDPDIDFQLPMTGLQRRFRRRIEDFPRGAAYLRADPGKTDRWRERLAALGTGLRVGISWRGGTPETHVRRRTIPLAQWAPLLRTPGVHFVSLQYSNVTAELAELRDTHGIDIAHWQEGIDDFDESAALLGALDLVISVPTTVVHLSGALDVPAWVLVPFRPGFRYMREGATMPWYRSVTLLRQRDPERWDDVLAEVQARLDARRAGSHSMS